MRDDLIGAVLGEGSGSSKVLYSDIVDGNRGFARGPVRSLMSALLFDSIQAFMAFATAATENQRARYREAYEWVSRTEKEYIFSFESVCEGLGVDPNYLRLGLLNAAGDSGSAWKRSRRNF